ncbi:MAG: hypothetical protein Q7J72_01405 [Candidatus Omnitrophota bacterium]|nr:hypothetical protein [Candidatus Omnitrophota bacterium]
MQKLHFSHINGNKIIYVGISNRGLRSRVFYDHFIGNNSGWSTLRKSLGVLILRNPNKMPRNKNCKPHQYKFEPKDENKLTTWMKNNLILYYTIVKNPMSYEYELIEGRNPPLNINKNENIINSEFRKKLRKLRKNY